jgi:hypothetical protein
LLPSRADWFAFYERDYPRPIAERENYSLVWLFDDDDVVGFSSADQIEFGEPRIDDNVTEISSARRRVRLTIAS